ncbi:MAG TPA: hypothetical protein VFR02_10125 [bacterium]|nr:hypothetical protein [bacterium]
MDPASPPAPAGRRTNLDAECLRCGAFNVAENRICGACGASLPLVYDEEGNVFEWERGSSPAGRPFTPYRVDPRKTGWFLRAGVLLFALGVAALIILRGARP